MYVASDAKPEIELRREPQAHRERIEERPDGCQEGDDIVEDIAHLGAFRDDIVESGGPAQPAAWIGEAFTPHGTWRFGQVREKHVECFGCCARRHGCPPDR